MIKSKKSSARRLDSIDEKFEEILGYGIKLRKPTAGSYPDTKMIVKLGEEDNWFPLEKLSDGMFRVLRILMQLESSKEGDIRARVKESLIQSIKLLG